MVSRAILAVHTALFASFIAGSLAVSVVLLWWPGVLSGRLVVIVFIALAVLVIGSWPTFGGCPFTVWEKDASKREGRTPYQGPCIDHYAKQWFGITLSGQTSTYILVLLLLLPIALGIWRW